MSSAPERPSAIVLAGASALGAYQAGVLRYLVHEVARDLPRGFGFDILSGTSAGSINALALASAADDPVAAVDTVCAAWTSLELRAVLRPSAIEVLAMTADLAGVPGRLKRALRAHGVRGGLLDARPFARILESVATPGAIADHLAHGHLRALAMSTTHVATGRAVVFHQSHAAVRSGGDASAMTPAVLTVQHALASAAIPLLFPAVAWPAICTATAGCARWCRCRRRSTWARAAC
jgi:NTE family protein